MGLDFAQGTLGFQILGIPRCLGNLRSFGSQKPEACGPYRAIPATRFDPGHQAEMLRLQLPVCAVWWPRTQPWSYPTGVGELRLLLSGCVNHPRGASVPHL